MSDAMVVALQRARHMRAAFYQGAFVALNVTPGLSIALELASLTRTEAEATCAVDCMRIAPEHGKVIAALDYLRGCRAREVSDASSGVDDAVTDRAFRQRGTARE